MIVFVCAADMQHYVIIALTGHFRAWYEKLLLQQLKPLF